MKFSLQQLIEDFDLNDFKVCGIELDIIARHFRLNIEGAYWFKNKDSEPIVFEKGGSITVTNYLSFEARYFRVEDRLWRTLDYSNLEFMPEINVKSYHSEVLSLAGNAKNGYWMEYLIRAGVCKIEFNE